jgi:hypothetical protein
MSRLDGARQIFAASSPIVRLSFGASFGRATHRGVGANAPKIESTPNSNVSKSEF